MFRSSTLAAPAPLRASAGGLDPQCRSGCSPTVWTWRFARRSRRWPWRKSTIG